MLIPPDRQDEEPAILQRLRRGERIDHYETVRQRKDGRLIEVSLSVSPVKDETGCVVGAAKIARDISERKRAERLQRLLIDELNHRVKNTLATVQAIAHLTVRTAKTPSEFAEAFTGRLQALAKTHTLLTQTSWAGADLQQLALDQLLLGAGEDKRIWLSGPSVALDPQTALQLSLVLHELATNARKYGALSVVHGKLALSWSIEQKEARELVLIWQESDGPAVTVPSSTGFGTKLMHESLRAQGGSVSIRYASNGVVCEIRLPLRSGGGGAYRTFGDERIEDSDHQSRVAKPRILIVDDEPLIAMDVAGALRERDFEVVGPASSVESAEELVQAGGVDAAIIDSNLGGKPADDLAASLTRRDIPFAFLTGYERKDLPKAFRHAPLIRKPFDRNELISVLADLTRPRDGVARLRPLSQRESPSR